MIRAVLDWLETYDFDDGIEQDKKIISILKEYGIRGCTFNLNSGLMG